MDIALSRINSLVNYFNFEGANFHNYSQINPGLKIKLTSVNCDVLIGPWVSSLKRMFTHPWITSSTHSTGSTRKGSATDHQQFRGVSNLINNLFVLIRFYWKTKLPVLKKIFIKKSSPRVVTVIIVGCFMI